MTPLVSVVIPTYKRPELLARCLRAVSRQSLPPAQFEVVVVDDEPSAATGAAVDELRPLFESLRYVPMRDAHGPAAARNAGWTAARAPVIAFTDDDTIPRPTWLEAGLASMAEGLAAVSARVVVPVSEVPTDYERNIQNLETSRFVTANAFYRRDVLQAVGGFDEGFPVAWREDSDLYFRVEAAGYPCGDAPESVVEHPVRTAAWGVSIGEQRKTQYNALLHKKHPERYRRDLPGPPRLRYYSILASAGLAAAGLARRSPLLASLGAGAWLVQTAAFAAKRLDGTSHLPSHVAEMLATSAVIPPLSTYWRLRGAVRYRTWFP